MLTGTTQQTKREAKETIKRAEEEVVRVRTSRQDHFAEFGKKYWERPDLFAHDCVRWREGEGLTPYQDAIMQAVPEHRKVCVRGCHALGKSACCAILVLWFALTRDALRKDWKIVSTAGTNNQLKQYLWPEIRKWARELDWEVIGRPPFSERDELFEMSIKLRSGRAFAVVPEEPGKMEGAHADELFFCFDEAKLIQGAIWDAAEGAFAGANPAQGRFAYALAISTPGEPNGRFYDIQSRKVGYDDWHPVVVTIEEVIAAGRTTREFVRQRAKQWGDTSAVFLQKVMGQFAATDEESVIPLHYIEQACDRWEEVYGIAA